MEGTVTWDCVIRRNERLGTTRLLLLLTAAFGAEKKGEKPAIPPSGFTFEAAGF